MKRVDRHARRRYKCAKLHIAGILAPFLCKLLRSSMQPVLTCTLECGADHSWANFHCTLPLLIVHWIHTIHIRRVRVPSEVWM